MSASNWDKCPGCIAKARKEVEERADTLRTGYGSLSQDEYMKLVHAPVPDVLTSRGEQTFREDYEIWGADTGIVKVSYSGSCTVCRAKLSFEFEKEISTQ